MIKVKEDVMPEFPGTNLAILEFDTSGPMPPYVAINGDRASTWDEFVYLVEECTAPGIVEIRVGMDDSNPTVAWVENVVHWPDGDPGPIVLRGLVWTRNPWGKIPGFRGHTITLEKFDGELEISF